MSRERTDELIERANIAIKNAKERRLSVNIEKQRFGVPLKEVISRAQAAAKQSAERLGINLVDLKIPRPAVNDTELGYILQLMQWIANKCYYNELDQFLREHSTIDTVGRVGAVVSSGCVMFLLQHLWRELGTRFIIELALEVCIPGGFVGYLTRTPMAIGYLVSAYRAYSDGLVAPGQEAELREDKRDLACAKAASEAKVRRITAEVKPLKAELDHLKKAREQDRVLQLGNKKITDKHIREQEQEIAALEEKISKLEVQLPEKYSTQAYQSDVEDSDEESDFEFTTSEQPQTDLFAPTQVLRKRMHVTEVDDDEQNKPSLK